MNKKCNDITTLTAKISDAGIEQINGYLSLVCIFSLTGKHNNEADTIKLVRIIKDQKSLVNAAQIFERIGLVYAKIKSSEKSEFDAVFTRVSDEVFKLDIQKDHNTTTITHINGKII